MNHHTDADVYGMNHHTDADFTVRLVSKGGVYSWNEGSKEDNAFLLAKAGFISRENCIPHLAHVKANGNCKVDMELCRADILEVKLPTSRKQRRANEKDETNNGKILLEKQLKKYNKVESLSKMRSRKNVTDYDC